MDSQQPQPLPAPIDNADRIDTNPAVLDWVSQVRGRFGGRMRCVVGYVAALPIDLRDATAYTRVYLTLDLDYFLTIKNTYIVHYLDMASLGNRLAGVVLWVERDATILESRIHEAGEFLRGDLTRQFLDTSIAVSPGSRPDPDIQPPSLGRVC